MRTAKAFGTFLLLAPLMSLAACRRQPSPAPAASAAGNDATASASIASAAPSAPPSTYDPAPLLTSLRPSRRSGLEAALGVHSVNELPLYDLSLRLDDTLDTFQLDEKIVWTNTTASREDEVVLRLYANETAGKPVGPDAARVLFDGGRCEGASCAVSVESASTLIVKPDQGIAPGARIEIALTLRGKLESIDSSRTNVLAQSIESLSMLGGGEASSYGLLAKGDGIASLANFYAVVSPRRDGKWERSEASTIGDLGSDEMSNVHAVVDAPAGTNVATTGVVAKDDTSHGRRIEEIDAGVVRDFAIVTSPSFDVLTRDVGGVTVRSWFLKSERKAGEKVLDVAAHALEIYERRFGPYPYADFDVVEAALVGGAGGVEFAGLVTVASMLYRPAIPDGLMGQLFTALVQSTPNGKNPLDEITDHMLEFTTAHEVAHQWWHGLVGNDSRMHPYVDETLAQYSAIQYLDDRYGAARAKQDGDLDVAMNYGAMRMLGHPDGAVDRGAAAFGDVMSYAGLIYGKGPYLWVALRKELGDEPFFRGVRAYVGRNQLRIAGARALVDELAAVDPAKATRVRELARRWLEESHGDEDVHAPSMIDLVAPSMGLDPGTLDPEAKKMMEDMLGSGLGGN